MNNDSLIELFKFKSKFITDSIIEEKFFIKNKIYSTLLTFIHKNGEMYKTELYDSTKPDKKELISEVSFDFNNQFPDERMK